MGDGNDYSFFTLQFPRSIRIQAQGPGMKAYLNSLVVSILFFFFPICRREHVHMLSRD